MTSTPLTALCDRYWIALLARAPIVATRLGDRRFEAQLAAIDADSRAAVMAELQEFLSGLAALDRSAFTEDESTTAAILELQVRRALGEREHGLELLAVNQMYGPQVSFLQLGPVHPMDAAGRETYVTRLAAFPQYIDDYLDLLREGLAAGVIGPRLVIDRVDRQLIDLLAVPTEKSPLLVAADRVDEADRDAYRARILDAVNTHVLPSYERFHAFLRDTYLPRATETIGLAALPGGAEAYAHRIWYHTTLRRTAQEIHDQGLELMDVLETRMREISNRAGHGDDLSAYNAALRSDPANTYATGDDVIAHATELLERATTLLPRYFGRLPRTVCKTREIEDFRAKDAPAGYYQGAPGDASRPAHYVVNTSRPQERMRSNMPALSLHEAVPGHHLQISLARESGTLHRFRRSASITSFVEGWALYTERLGQEMGFYDDDRTLYGMLTYQAWRASRLVVDTGMHAFGWSRERAVDYLREHVAIAESEIQNEIDRYILWPGQALAYMVGCEHISDLRHGTEAVLGDAFDLPAFHDELLRHGAVPLGLLSELMADWTERQSA